MVQLQDFSDQLTMLNFDENWGIWLEKFPNIKGIPTKEWGLSENFLSVSANQYHRGMVKKLCRLNQRYYWLRNFLLEQISSHISFIVTFCEPFLFPDIVIYTIGNIVTLTSLAAPLADLVTSDTVSGSDGVKYSFAQNWQYSGHPFLRFDFFAWETVVNHLFSPLKFFLVS